MEKFIKRIIIIIVITGYFNMGAGVGTAEAIQEELTVALSSNAIKGFDPFLYTQANGSPLIQSTLLSFDKDMGITYDLADEYQVSEDKMTWEFKIRDDAYFSNGEQVKASDVAFTFNTAKYNGWHDLSLLKEVKVIDEYTIHFRLEKPLSTFSYTAAQLGIVPENQYDELFTLNPIGSGPYILKEWNVGEQAVFVRNERYYGKKPIFKRIIILFMNEEEAYAAAQKDLVDVAQTSPAFANVGVIDGMDINAFKGSDQYGISFTAAPTKSDVTVKETGNEVTSEWPIRQAINLTVNRDYLINEVLYGYGEAAYHDADRLPWGYKETEVEYNNIDKAKEILQIAGWIDNDEDGVLEKQGIEAKFKLLFLESDPIAQSMGTLLMHQLAEIGISVEVVSQNEKEINSNKFNNPLIMRVGNHSPIDLYHRFHEDNSRMNLRISADVNQLVEGALASGDFKIWQSILRQTAKDLPWIWLVHPNHLYYTKKGLNLGETAFQSNEQPLFLLNNIEEWTWE